MHGPHLIGDGERARVRKDPPDGPVGVLLVSPGDEGGPLINGASTPGTIAHGLLEMGILAEALSRWAGSADRLMSLEVRFSKPLVAGGTNTCTGRVVAVDEAGGIATLDVEAVSDRGERVLTNGRATVRLSG